MQKLSTKLFLTIFVGIVLITFSYFYIDKPVAFWIYHQQLFHYTFLIWFTYFANVLVFLAALSYVYYVICFCLDKIKLHAKLLLAMANSIVIAAFFKDQLKFIFGRYWPNTWTNNNPSLIHDNAYGFHFFHNGSWYASFPSGHTTITVAAMTVLWLLLPRWRWLSILVSALVMIGLIGMDYHFVSDVIGGAFLGVMVAALTVKISYH